MGGPKFYLSGGTFSFYFLQYFCHRWNFCTLVVQSMAYIYRHMSVQWKKELRWDFFMPKTENVCNLVRYNLVILA